MPDDSHPTIGPASGGSPHGGGDPLSDLVCEVFMLTPGEFSDDTRRDEIDTWDSLAVTSLVLQLRQRFGVEASPERVAGIERLGDLRRIAEGG